MKKKLKTKTKIFGQFKICATAIQTPLSQGANVKVFIMIDNHLISCSNGRLDLLNDENLDKVIEREWDEFKVDIPHEEYVSME